MRREQELHVHMVVIVVTLALACMTFVWREWIEFVFRVDPDRRSGAAEWLVVGACCCAALASTLRRHAVRTAADRA
jgi:hypothetical protein